MDICCHISADYKLTGQKNVELFTSYAYIRLINVDIKFRSARTYIVVYLLLAQINELSIKTEFCRVNSFLSSMRWIFLLAFFVLLFSLTHGTSDDKEVKEPIIRWGVPGGNLPKAWRFRNLFCKPGERFIFRRCRKVFRI